MINEEKQTLRARVIWLENYLQQLIVFLHNEVEPFYKNSNEVCFELSYENQIEIRMEIERVKVAISTLKSCHGGS